MGTLNFVDQTEDTARPKVAAMLGKKKTLATVEIVDKHFAEINVWDGVSVEPAYTTKIDLTQNPKFEERFQTKEKVDDEFLNDFLMESSCGTFKVFFVRTGAPGDVGAEIFLELGDIILLRFYRRYDNQEQKFDVFEIWVDDITPGWQEPIYKVEWPIKKKEPK